MSTEALVETPSTEALLDVTELRKEFPSRGRGKTRSVKAVDGVSIRLDEGRTLGLVGETGCGKSTTARLIMRLMEPTSGQIRYKGTNVAHLGRRELAEMRRGVQMVFQDPYSALDPRMTVRQLISEPMDINHIGSRGERQARVAELMELVGLHPEHADRFPHQFSGGQRQRISIARALAMNPKVLVLDEPVSALDVSLQVQIIALLHKLQQQFGISYLFISHDLSVVRTVCDDVAVMYLGKIVEAGPVAEVFAKPSHPYTQALLSSVPLADPALRGSRERIILTGDLPSPSNRPTGCSFRQRCRFATEECAAVEPALSQDATIGHAVACHHAEVRDVLGVASEDVA
ncbi:MAG TPA: dipeptide ABC transporter ATP-binding protein [Gryllotalpicola sp.]